MPPTTSTNVMPAASRAMITVSTSRLAMFPPVRKNGLASEKKTTMPTKITATATPSMAKTRVRPRDAVITPRSGPRGT